jgi:hypothetical protein
MPGGVVGRAAQPPSSHQGRRLCVLGSEGGLLGRGMAAGAPLDDDSGVLRHGAMGEVFGGIWAPSMLESFLDRLPGAMRPPVEGQPAGPQLSWPARHRCCSAAASSRSRAWTRCRSGIDPDSIGPAEPALYPNGDRDKTGKLNDTRPTSRPISPAGLAARWFDAIVESCHGLCSHLFRPQTGRP